MESYLKCDLHSLYSDDGRIVPSKKFMNFILELHLNMEISRTNNLEVGNRLASARTLEYMGYGYLRKGDYLNAYEAYEAATKSFIGTDLEERSCTRCKDNMAKIKDMQRNGHPDLNVGFNRPDNDINWPSLFYPGAPASV